MLNVVAVLLVLILGLAIATGITAWVIYNGLISKKNDVERAFSTIDVLLKKRSDLIPNLVASVQNYKQFEQNTLVEVTRLRSRVMARGVGRNERVDLENQISRSLGNILALAETYPELKASEQFKELQIAIYEVEEQISAARRFYNSAVNEYNNGIEMFPSNLIASSMNYQRRRFFEASEQERQNVDVNALFRR